MSGGSPTSAILSAQIPSRSIGRQVELFAQRHRDVLRHRQRAEQRAVLEQHAPAGVEPPPFRLAKPENVLAEDLDRARARRR